MVTNNRIVFNIKGNKYRLVVAIRYESSVVFIPFIGPHRGYDKIGRRHDLTTCAAWGIMACCWQLAIG